MKNIKLRKKQKESYTNKRNKNQIVTMTLSIALALSVSVSMYGLYIRPNADYKRAKYVLEHTMNINTIKDLPQNMKAVKPYLTTELYNHYGINDVDFTYYNYFKLRGGETRIEVLDHRKGFSQGSITFRIFNDNININRRFIMLYKTKGSKLCDVSYMEIVGKM